MATKAELEKRVQELEELSNEFEKFKRRVVEVGGRYARENDYCEDYDEMMAELGLDGVLSPDTVRAQVTVTFVVQAVWSVGRRTDHIEKKMPTSAKELEKHLIIDEFDLSEGSILDSHFGRERITDFDAKITDFKTGAR